MFLLYVDAPDAPGQPKVTGYDSTWASLAWTPPLSNGGRPITGYIVEKRERGGEWSKVNHIPSPGTNDTVPNLTPGGRYEFRVSAVDDAGPGKPSKPTAPITAEEPKCTFGKQAVWKLLEKVKRFNSKS